MAKAPAVQDYKADSDITQPGNVEDVIASLEDYISETTRLEMATGAEALKKYADDQPADVQAG